MNNEIIDVSYIREYSNLLNKDREELKSLYENKIKKVLENNYELISKNSNYNEYTNRIISLINDIDYKISDLYRLLVTEIIPGYEETSTLINKHFNADFQNEISSLTNEINK